MPALAARLLAALVIVLCVHPLLAQGPLDFDGLPADELVVTWRPEPPEAVSEDSVMINRLRGVAAIVDAPTRRLLAARSRRAPEIGWPAELEPAGYLHARRGDARRVLAFVRTSDGIVLVRDVDATDRRAACREFPEAQFAALLAPLRTYSGPFRAVAPEADLARTVQLAQPYRASGVILDERTIRERLNGGRQTELPPTDRYLRDETLLIRLPTAYSPVTPAGLLVWIDAGDSGSPPPQLVPAADELGIIMIGAADSGNRRLATDRYQLALDAVATARERYHIDAARVYVSGISGGGRVSSVLIGCFPDIFAGAVPIVGLDCYEHIPVGDGRFVPANYRRPDADLWRLLAQRRIAPITGELDSNHRVIQNAVRIMQGDGLAVRLFEYEDMAHNLPTAERFAEALRWVDEPARLAREEAWRDAADALASYEAKFGEAPVASDAQRRILEQITVTGPWSPGAWRACELLGVVPVVAAEP